MFADVAVGQEVVEPMAEAFTERDGHERCEVQIADGLRAETVAAGHDRSLEEDGRGDVDAHGPHEGHGVVQHAGNHNRLEQGRDHAPRTRPERLEVAMILDLPDSQHAHHARPARRLAFVRDAAVVKRLVHEEDDEDQIETADGEDEPHHRSPVAGAGQDEVAEEGRQVRRHDEEGHPDSDLAGVFVEEEHVFDTSQAGHLERGKGHAHQGAEGVEDGKVRGDGAGQREGSTQEGAPEHDRCSSPPGGY